MSSREAILARLRGVQRAAPAAVAPYRPSIDDPIARFKQRLGMVFASAEDIASLADLPSAVAAYLAGQGSMPADVAVATEFAGLGWTEAGLVTAATPGRASMAAAVSRIHVAIAETGSLMMSSRDAHGPWPNLLADTHIAVIDRTAIVPSFEDAIARMAGNRLPRSLHTATGPSRTGDIEQTLELGAHGAVRLHVMIVADERSP